MKHLSLSLVAVCVAVLVAAAAGLASKASAPVKKSGPSSAGLALVQIKPERSAETRDFNRALTVYESLSSAQGQIAGQIKPLSIEAEKVAGSPVDASNSGNRTLFAGLDASSRLPGGQVAISAAKKFATKPLASKSSEVSAKQKSGSNDVKQPKALDLPQVTVVVIDGKTNKAMINGSLVGVNTLLAGGYVVKEINIDSVVVGLGNEEVVIKIPLQRLRVLGAQETTRAGGV
jgi:hypothetical protein